MDKPNRSLRQASKYALAFRVAQDIAEVRVKLFESDWRSEHFRVDVCMDCLNLHEKLVSDARVATVCGSKLKF